MSVRVLHVYKTYFPDTQGGLEEAVRQIYLNVGPEGIENRIFTLSGDPRPPVLEREEARVYRSRRHAELASASISLTALRGFRRLVEWADVVHYQHPWPFADLLHLAARVRKPSLVTYQSDIVRQRLLMPLYGPLMNAFLRRVDRIVATSPNYLASSPILQRFADKVDIIPNGLADGSCPAAPQDRLETVRARVGEGFLLFIGVLRYYKGLHVLLDALEGAALPVVIAGSGPEEDVLRRRAQAAGLDNVRFLGRVSDADKSALLQLCRGVVFPSHLRSEAFGVTLLEGAMHARPLISAEIGTGTTYINRHGETGLVVEPGDPVDLRQAMTRLIDDRDLAIRLGEGARARYERLFSGPVMGRRYAELYRRLVNGD